MILQTDCPRIVLVAPEIPQNTGTIGRLCVCVGAELHLIEPLGFEVSETRLRRAGLDYWRHLDWRVHSDWRSFTAHCAPDRMFFLSAHGEKSLYDTRFEATDWLVFGNETSGLPSDFYEEYADRLLAIPMPGENARTHNLANAVSIAVYEALRQTREW